MTQLKRMSGLSLTTILTAGAGALAVAAATLLFTNSETLIRSSFGSALVASSTTTVVPVRAAKAPPLAGSEDFWLSAMRQDGQSPLTKTVAIGDRIAMTLGGVERHLDVAAVSEFEPKITTIDTASNASRFVLVTARDSRDASARPIRFVMEIENADAPVAGLKPARTL